jgi:hypothetical protein
MTSILPSLLHDEFSFLLDTQQDRAHLEEVDAALGVSMDCVSVLVHV